MSDAGERRLVTRAEAAVALGYSPRSLATVMSRHRDRWPAPVGRRRVGRVWQHLYDLDEMLAAAPPARPDRDAPLTSAATISDPDGLLTCLECEGRYRSLGRHLAAAHAMTGAEYREAHQLPATGALWADGLRADAQARQRAALVEDPDHLAHLTPYQTPQWARRIAASAAEPLDRTRGYDLVRLHRLPGQRHAVRQMVAARLARLDRAAQEHGYRDLADAIAATRTLTAAEAARRIGVSPQTVRRRRATRA